MAKEIEVLFSGVDTLDLIFQGRLPKETCDMLMELKQQAQDQRGPVYAEIGPGKVKCHVYGSAPRGTSFHIDTGEDAEKWFITKSQDVRQWNIRCSVRAEGLRDYGYAAARPRLYQRLEDMACKVIDERISRIDYAIDVLIDGDFCPDPGQFVCHHHTRVSAHEDRLKDDREFNVHYYNHRPNSVTVGSKAHRQIAIYNKRREILQSSKKMGWFITWGTDPKDDTKQVWRVEIRAARAYLDKFGIKNFDDIEASMADVFLHALDAVRYVDYGQTDTNVTRQRLHPLWGAVRNQVETELFYYRSGLLPSNTKTVRREELESRSAVMTCGIAATMAFASGCRDGKDVPEATYKMMRKAERDNPGMFDRKLDKSGQKFHFLEDRKARRGNTS